MNVCFVVVIVAAGAFFLLTTVNKNVEIILNISCLLVAAAGVICGVNIVEHNEPHTCHILIFFL